MVQQKDLVDSTIDGEIGYDTASMRSSDIEIDDSISSSDWSSEGENLADKYLAPIDSDDDFERPFTTIGDISVKNYDELPHLGYDLDGQKIWNPVTADQLDEFLEKFDSSTAPKFNDGVTHKDIELNDEEIDILERLHSSKAQLPSEDSDELFVDNFTSETMQMPLTAAPEPKRRFIPSKWEHKKIMKIVRLIRAGILRKDGKKVSHDDNSGESQPRFYQLWSENDTSSQNPLPNHVPAPKQRLPDHFESYNPPEEYLLNEEEKEQWKSTDPEDRERNFLPQKFNSLRTVPGYSNFVKERFERCLDLYLCPRTTRIRVTDPDSLLPELPDPKELEPFPKHTSVVYELPESLYPMGDPRRRVRSIDFSPCGTWVLSGHEGGLTCIWDVLSGRCIKTLDLRSLIPTSSDEWAVLSCAWNPNEKISLVAVAFGPKLILFDPGLSGEEVQDATEELTEQTSQSPLSSAVAAWQKASDPQFSSGIRLIIDHSNEITNLSWHNRGDYFVAVCSSKAGNPVIVHQLSKQISQSPFKKSKGYVQKVLFHPKKPFLVVATKQSIRIYNLIQQELHRKLQAGAKWISSMDIHPSGDNLIVGTFDKKVYWFDMDLSSKPYKVLKHHNLAVRGVSFHQKYPLFGTCGDDGIIQIFHSMVYEDLMKNPLIVPVKKILAHQRGEDGLGILDCKFHPIRPWIMSGDSRGTMKLFT